MPLEQQSLVVKCYMTLFALILQIRSRRLSSRIRSYFKWWLGQPGQFESRREIEIFLRHDWYHDFSPLGLKTNQFRSAFYRKNQQAKQDELFDLIDRAIASCPREPGPGIKGVELFCADGFYANYAASRGVRSMLGVDLDADSVEARSGVLEQARLVTRLLGNGDYIHYRKADVFDLDGSWDICICAGGLYHLTDPRRLLTRLRRQVKTALVLQTVVSLENQDPSYFVTPAPGLTWGCRFSSKHLDRMIETSGWEIMERRENQLPGNIRLCDRGSVYLLCRPRESNPVCGPTNP